MWRRMKEKKRFIHGSIFVEKRGEEKEVKWEDKSSSLVFTSRSFSVAARVGKQKKMIDNTNF